MATAEPGRAGPVPPLAVGTLAVPPLAVAPLAVSHHTLVTALGHGRDATVAALQAGRTGLARQTFETATGIDTWLGVVTGADAVRIAPALAEFDCRNNRIAELALQADGFGDAVRRAARRHGAARVGVFLGTSTSGILHTEVAYRHRDPATGALPGHLHYGSTHNTYSVARYVRAALGLRGPAHVVSTACSSSAKVFAAAQRMVALGVVDAAVVGGVDSLCMTTLYGFKSLELVSPDICRPWDAQRAGLSLGEGAAFALLERDPQDPVQAWLLGAGESSDGHHMSSPHPQGAGAAAAMRGALAQAGLQPQQLDYLNLHGTGTPGNDAAEDRAVCDVFGTTPAGGVLGTTPAGGVLGTTPAGGVFGPTPPGGVLGPTPPGGVLQTTLPCSSTKGFTGHTLGAAGGVEAGICMLALQHGFMPASLNLHEPDPALHAQLVRSTVQAPGLRTAASNSFGFGGSNACLVFGRA